MERQQAESYLLELQQRALHAHLATRRPRATPHTWAYGFAGKPREFLHELIGKDWEGSDWQSWRAFISVVFGQPLETIGEWRVFRQCTGLEQPPRSRPPSVWMPIGRRGGKSRILAAIAVYLACCYDWSGYLDPGELGVLPVLAADRRQARTIMGYVKAFLSHPQLAPLIEHDQIESIALKGNVLIEVVTASFRAVRSRTVIAALCDELAFWRSEDSSANPDREIIAALEPAMATIPNALLLGASSPYARRGVLWDMYERHYGKDEGPLIWKAPTRVMNPTVPQRFIDEQYTADPLSAAAEYGADFRSDVDAFLIREALDATIAFERRELEPQFGVQYKAFVDPSGGSSDSMTLAIGHVDRRSKRAVLDLLRERRPPFSPEAVVSEFVATLRDYRVAAVQGDHYAGEWPRERFRQAGVHYEVSKRHKSDIYIEFLPLVNAQRVELLDHRGLYNQLLGLERRTARGGHESIDHAPGAHDDLANVCAGVCVELLGKAGPLSIDRSVVENSARIIRPQYPLLDNLTPVWR